MTEITQEARWVHAAKRGDQAAFESLVQQYEKKVFALTLRVCGNPDDAAEAAQDAFLSAWQGLPLFRGDSSFSTWLYRLSYNACINLLRRENRHRSASGGSLDDGELNLDVPDAGTTPSDSLERQELRNEIEEGLRSLTPEHREVLVLREIHQLSYGEIAGALGLDVGTVKSRINRGRKQLRNFLLQKGNFFGPSASKE